MVRRLHAGLIVIAAIVIVVGLLVLAFTSGAISLSGPTTLTLSNVPTVVKVNGNQYVISLRSSMPASNIAYIYIGRSPVFINPTLNVTLVLYNTTKVNAGMHSYANMNIRLNSLTNTSAAVTITPLQAYLNESPDYSRIHVIGYVTSNASGVSTSILQVSSSTTTIAQALTPQQKITNYLKNNEWYGLMQNYTRIYANTRNCTPTLYNSSYGYQYGKLPQGPFTYANVSYVSPYAVTFNVTYSGKGNYLAVWTMDAKSAYSQGRALSIGVNLSTGSILNTTLTGAFKGLSYSTLQSSLVQAGAVGNACGILVVT